MKHEYPKMPRPEQPAYGEKSELRDFLKKVRKQEFKGYPADDWEAARALIADGQSGRLADYLHLFHGLDFAVAHDLVSLSSRSAFSVARNLTHFDKADRPAIVRLLILQGYRGLLTARLLTGLRLPERERADIGAIIALHDAQNRTPVIPEDE